MANENPVAVDGGDAEEEHADRLMALLHDLVRTKGRRGAARALDIDHRTVDTGMDGGGLTWRMREALERALRDGDGSAAARQGARNDGLSSRVDALEKELHDAISAVKDEMAAMREEHAGALAKIERRLARGEAHRESAAETNAPCATESVQEKEALVAQPKIGKPPKRKYSDLVTKEPALDDQEVYGKAWPLIEEWRGIWEAGHTGVGKGLTWLETEERVRGLEVAMLEEHGLTLPPETEPLTGLWRSSQLNWRKETLNEVRRAVAWRHLLRKVLTCGLWRSRWWRGRA